MRSIRLSLIVYFLLLLTGALGAVSWFSYSTASDAVHQREKEVRAKIEETFDRRTRFAKREVDHRLRSQAQTLASMRLVTVNYEAIHLASMMSACTTPQWGRESLVAMRTWLPLPPKDAVNFPLTPLWFAQAKGAMRYDPAREISRFYPKFTHIDSSESLVANADHDQPQEYFQTYNGKGQPMQRSDSMGDAWFSLTEAHREQAPLTEQFDDVELKPGQRVRRITLKTPVAGYGGVIIWPWRPAGINPKNGKQQPPPPPIDTKTQTIFIQYAADLAPLEAKVSQFQRDRDSQLVDLESTIHHDLAQLRNRMIVVYLGTLIALWLGGYLVIRLGLAPLAKMSDAVSQVSPTNIQLKLDAHKLPSELQPIAERLAEVLDHLKKAFAREKQAAADISHELRTPLAALMTTLEVGLKKSRSAEEYREILDECRASGQHMYQLVERLLTLARLDAGVDQYRPADTDVTEVAINCADLIRPLARARGLTLRLHLPDPITTETDPNKLREVLTNLLHNAVEYNKDNGAIDLSVERVNSRVRIEVRDTGIGIKPDQREHLFERFYRADPSRHADTPHAGLGLAIVKSYVDLMGGTISVESSDAGTAFILELPYAASIHDIDTAVKEMPALAQR